MFVLAIALTVIALESSGFGENHLKFHKNKAVIFWLLMFAEKMVIASLLGTGNSWAMYAVVGVKAILVIFYCKASLFFEPIQKARSVTMHIIHLLLMTIFVVNFQYL